MLIDVCFVHFRSCRLKHLDAAWYSLSRQDLSGVECVRFLDNNTCDRPEEIATVLNRHALPIPVHPCYFKHGNPNRTHSWSVNRVCAETPGDRWILFARSDYILAFDCLARLRAAVTDESRKQFVSGWCWQMAYDDQANNFDNDVDIEQYGWRNGGMQALMRHPYGYRFHNTDQDAGVWFTRRHNMIEAGSMNEEMTSWGFQQSTFQRALRSAGVEMLVVPDYLFAHQHHLAHRDFSVAQAEYDRFGKGV